MSRGGQFEWFFMLIFNLNIRGLGGGTKARYLRRCIATEEAEFVCLQETKTVEVTDVRCYALWGGQQNRLDS